MSDMIDVQKQKPEHPIPLDKVGVRGLAYPIVVLDRAAARQTTIADVSMYVDLPHNFRGTHMSRFVAILNRHRGRITPQAIDQILNEMRQTFAAERAHIEFSFPYFVEKTAPISKEKALLEYRCRFIASMEKERTLEVEVSVPVTILCPCSKEISARGAHNQRAIVTVRFITPKLVWIEEIAEIIDASASCPIYPLLKRTDEKHVTETAYDNPRFVEDVVREVAEHLWNDERITHFSVECESLESIHNHSAYAYLKKYPKEQLDQ